MCAEASTGLRAVVAHFFFNCWYLDIPSENPTLMNHEPFFPLPFEFHHSSSPHYPRLVVLAIDRAIK
jgi:hypothetical protein